MHIGCDSLFNYQGVCVCLLIFASQFAFRAPDEWGDNKRHRALALLIEVDLRCSSFDLEASLANLISSTETMMLSLEPRSSKLKWLDGFDTAMGCPRVLESPIPSPLLYESGIPNINLCLAFEFRDIRWQFARSNLTWSEAIHWVSPNSLSARPQNERRQHELPASEYLLKEKNAHSTMILSTSDLAITLMRPLSANWDWLMRFVSAVPFCAFLNNPFFSQLANTENSSIRSSWPKNSHWIKVQLRISNESKIERQAELAQQFFNWILAFSIIGINCLEQKSKLSRLSRKRNGFSTVIHPNWRKCLIISNDLPRTSKSFASFFCLAIFGEI